MKFKMGFSDALRSVNLVNSEMLKVGNYVMHNKKIRGLLPDDYLTKIDEVRKAAVTVAWDLLNIEEQCTFDLPTIFEIEDEQEAVRCSLDGKDAL